MPKTSRETAPERFSTDGLDVATEHLEGGYSACFESHSADVDLAPLFQGLPGDVCQVPRWGYVVGGKITFRLADGEETYEAGEAYYVPPGHTPIHHAGAEIVEFSPTEGLKEVIAVVKGNLEAAEARA